MGGGDRGRALRYRSNREDPLNKPYTLPVAQLHNPRRLNIFATLGREMSDRCSILVCLQRDTDSI